MAIGCIHVPMSETPCPVTKRRKLRCDSARSIGRTRFHTAIRTGPPLSLIRCIAFLFVGPPIHRFAGRLQWQCRPQQNALLLTAATSAIPVASVMSFAKRLTFLAPFHISQLLRFLLAHTDGHARPRPADRPVDRLYSPGAGISMEQAQANPTPIAPRRIAA